jgi:hypothetical protein
MGKKETVGLMGHESGGRNGQLRVFIDAKAR